MRPNTESRGLGVREHEAARLAADVCNGSTFMDRVLRVDLVGRISSQDRGDSVDGDPKSSVFVGNLDFGSKEEDLRVFFEALGAGERVPPADNDEQDGEIANVGDQGSDCSRQGISARERVCVRSIFRPTMCR
ncbi:hypothetical protein ARMSODRAFT_444130 [Armillaria solidipes]|uniref:RRM domain-containing protein n=1 Tax=Armillaria solidipes TaxID=1076256 RepID=A0A2H3B614_9AGAR|nr:hypothetical protein ARMSODRAFT_444130 [Armillaria solidipes]